MAYGQKLRFYTNPGVAVARATLPQATVNKAGGQEKEVQLWKPASASSTAQPCSSVEGSETLPFSPL